MLPFGSEPEGVAVGVKKERLFSPDGFTARQYADL